MRVKRLNLRLAILLPVLVLLVVGGVYLLHSWQVRRTASGMKAQAEQSQAAGKRTEAIRQYQTYISYASQDHAARSQLALLVAEEAEHTKKAADLRQALALLEQAARRDPENQEVLRRLADYSLAMGRFSDAMSHLQRLLQASPQDGKLLFKLARCHLAQEHHAEAREALEKAITLDPTQVEAYIALAELYGNRTNQPQEAEATLKRLITANPKLANAYLARGRVYLRARKTEPAREDFQKASELAPDDLDVLLANYELAALTGKLEDAEKQLQRAGELFPDHERVLRARADLQLRTKRPKEAAETLETLAEQHTQSPDQQAGLIQLLLETGEVAKAREQIQRLHQTNFPPPLLGYLDARLAMSEAKWLAASLQLEQVRPQLAAHPQWDPAVNLALGQCHERLGQHDLQVEAFQRVLERQPTLLRARLGRAAGLLRGGKTEPALQEYRQLRQALGDTAFFREPILRTDLYQALLRHTLQQPAGQRDWSEMNQFLTALAAAPNMDAGQLVLMRADALLAQDQLDQAYDLVVAQCQTTPKQPALWVERAKLAAARGGVAQGLAALDEANTAAGNPLLLRLARVDLALRLERSQAEAALEKVAAGVGELPEAERAPLWQALGAAYHRLGTAEKARDFWKQAAQAQPENAQLRLLLFELARDMGDEAAMTEASEQLKKLLGSRSAEWNYAEAARRVWKIAKEGKEAASLSEASELLNTAREQRPTWPQLARLEAEIALLQGNAEEAIRAYQRLRSQGSLSGQELRRLLALLTSRQRLDEARQLLSELDSADLTPDLKQMRAELTLRAGDRETALTLAQKAVADSTEARDFVWYGQFLLQAQRGDEAIAAFRRAVELAPKSPPPRLLLVASLVHAGKAAEARAEVDRFAQALSPEDLAKTLAQAYQILGERGLAEEQYQAAVKAQPDNLALGLQLAEFYIQGAQADRSQLPKAQAQLEKTIEQAGRDATKNAASLTAARRLLAVVLANSGDARQQEKALSLLAENTSGQPTPADLHAKAAVLGASPKPAAQAEAIALLEQLQKETGLNAEERLHLARLYDRQGQWPSGRKAMLDLLATQAEPQYLLAFLQMLFQHQASAEELAPWVEKLAALRPQDPITTVFQARWLAKSGDTAQAVSKLESLVPRPLPDEQLMRLVEVGLVLEDIQQPDKAQKFWEEFAERKPEGKLALAQFFGRQNQPDQAWQVCQSAYEKLPASDVITVALELLTREAQRGPLVAEHAAAVDAWLAKLLAEKDVKPEVQLQRELLLSRLRELQGRGDDLVQLYQRHLERPNLTDPQRAPMWNNLSYILAVHKHDGAQAVKLANQAIDVLGPAPELLDTRGMAHLAAGQFPEAIADLQQAIEGSPNGLKYFHLALAQQAAGDSRAAAEALKTAREKYELTAGKIPPLEQASYEKLIQALPEARGS